MMISAIVLTHNDAFVIERCLKSLLWCDEVIVVDDNSNDATIDVAKKYIAKIFIHSLNDDFAAQRNFGLSKANGEWVLFVDSDEVVTPQLASELMQAVEIPNPKSKIPKNGYFIKRKDYWAGKWLTHGELGQTRLLRLARKDAGLWKQPVHEVWDVKGPVGQLTHPILHYPHPKVAQFLDEINRYSSLYAEYLFQQGIREPSWYIVAKPVAKFFHNYLFLLGFLDGTAGAVVAIMMSFHSFLVRGKLWLLWHPVKS